MRMTPKSITLSLYKALLRAAAPFSNCNKIVTGESTVKIARALLHRSWLSDHKQNIDSHSNNIENTEDPANDIFHNYLRRLIGENKWMNLPNESNNVDLIEFIRSEFRVNENTFDQRDQLSAGFKSLKELHRKLDWLSVLLSSEHSSSELDDSNDTSFMKVKIPGLTGSETPFQKGTYLIAHPFMSGYFSKSVVIVLEHSEEGGTYGLVVNKDSGRSVVEGLGNSLPASMSNAFGSMPLRVGGPVNLSIQMMYCCSQDDEDTKFEIGGSVIPTKSSSIDEFDNEEDALQARRNTSDQAVFYRGNILRASEVILEEKMKESLAFDENKEYDPPVRFSIIAGSSCWESGQLQSELDKGFWIPVNGPPSISLSGSFTAANNNSNKVLVKGDNLWLSMIHSIGGADDNESGRLAKMLLECEKRRGIGFNGSSRNYSEHLGDACDVPG